MAEGRSKNRSPEHPAIPLEEAIERARVFYEKEHLHWASATSSLDHWGYSPKSGSGFRILGALRHYGILEERGRGDTRQVRMSELGKILVLRERGDPEWDEAVREAALTPAIHRKLWEKWGTEGRLPSNRTMQWELEGGLGFNPNAVDDFISTFRDSLAFANLTENDTLSDVESDDSPPSLDGREGVAEEDSRPPARPPMDAGSEATRTPRLEDYTIPLRGGGTAVLSIPVPLSRRNYQKLKGWLEWAEDSLTDEENGDGNGGGASEGG